MLYFIVNEKSRSGKGAEIWKEVKATLDERKVEYKAWITEYEGHACTLAHDICESEDTDICLVVLGGDGTANEVVNGMTNFEKVRFGTIPTGSGNDLARGLGIKGTPTEQLNRILACMEKGPQEAFCMDLGQVSFTDERKPRLFTISAGTGLDALVCKKALKSKLKDFLNKIHLGKLTYLILTVQSVFSSEMPDAEVNYNGEKEVKQNKTLCIAVMNFRTEGGGVPMAPQADATDGLLSICSIYSLSKLGALSKLPFLVVGKHKRFKGIDITDWRECTVRLKKPMVVHADGEYCGEADEMTFTCLPDKLRVLL